MVSKPKTPRSILRVSVLVGQNCFDSPTSELTLDQSQVPEGRDVQLSTELQTGRRFRFSA
jgi:hypothetical protein